MPPAPRHPGPRAWRGGKSPGCYPHQGGAESHVSEQERETGPTGQQGVAERDWECGASSKGEGPPTALYLFGDVAILVDVVKVKGPLELLVDCSSQEDGEANYKVLRREGRVQSDSPMPRLHFHFAVWPHTPVDPGLPAASQSSESATTL
ncbi:unnamed protein product [Gulo gulo]|uniref:Uncharacterized protein n=1 Tax=Gulo gulo TaxID=48420 RepID=A0A9X9M023_GULGU|nr:unnamed protein product [Gulo gulo]